jgi:dephospho-CoA kinase
MMRSEYETWLLSGAIGSGKSEVRRLLEEYGYRAISADLIGHTVLGTNQRVRERVAELWPNTLVDGQIDRHTLATEVFHDESELAKLENLTHPEIFKEIERIVALEKSTIFVELPLLMQPFDNSWLRLVVDTSYDIRKDRAIMRGMDPGDFDRRNALQPHRGRWLADADAVIPNQGNRTQLEDAVRLFVESLSLV